MNPPTQPSATPRTDAATNYCDANPVMPWVSADFARTLETELAAAKAECERLRTLNDNAGSALQWAKEELARLRADVERWSGGLDMSLPDLYEAAKSDRDKANAELARLRAELERLKSLAKFDGDRIHALNSEFATRAEVERWELAFQEQYARADRAETELARLRAEVAARPCPNVVCSKEGTQYCALAESSVAKLEAQLAAARKDSERFNLLATLLEDVNMGDIDPTKHRTEDNEWPDAWRAAIDAAMTNSNHKTT